MRSMKLVTAIAAITLAAPVFAGALTPGATAPSTDVKMMNVDGSEVSIADVAGEQGTMVVFTCNACPWAKAWEDRIVELGNAYQEKGIGAIAINPNDPGKVAADGYEQMKERAEAKGFGFPYVVDATSDVARAFGATRTPEVFLFDASWNLVYHGTIDNNAKEPEKADKHYLREALDAVAAGKAPAEAQTKAMGCTIKWRGE